MVSDQFCCGAEDLQMAMSFAPKLFLAAKKHKSTNEGQTIEQKSYETDVCKSGGRDRPRLDRGAAFVQF